MNNYRKLSNTKKKYKRRFLWNKKQEELQTLAILKLAQKELAVLQQSQLEQPEIPQLTPRKSVAANATRVQEPQHLQKIQRQHANQK